MKKIILFGYGAMGKRAVQLFMADENVELIGISDNRRLKDTPVPFVLPENLNTMDFDEIIVSVRLEKASYEIKQSLLDNHIPENKIILLINHPQLITRLYAETILYDENDPRIAWLKTYMNYIDGEKREGAVAECGVFVGDFSYWLNIYSGGRRKHYLFDTFEGFPIADIQAEREIGNKEFLDSRFNREQNWGRKYIDYTGKIDLMDIVEKKMKYQENCVFRKGYFPDTAMGINEKFAFVNLDMDLYQPMLAGLNFFIPHMVQGGIILLYDYFAQALPGVREAVDEYEEQNGTLAKFPIADNCSIGIVKS